MKAKALYWRNGLVVKLLERVAGRDDFLVKPVRYRATTKIHRPLIRANNFQKSMSGYPLRWANLSQPLPA